MMMEASLAKKKRICFVCLGNIVRSPLAQKMFQRLVEQAGLADRYEVDSAGIGDWHVGEPPDARMCRVAAQRGLVYSGSARQVRSRDFDDCDLIIAMDNDNRSALLRMARTEEQRAKIRLAREFDPLGGPKAPVPDPYYGGIDGFEEVYDIVERSMRGLLEALEREEV